MIDLQVWAGIDKETMDVAQTGMSDPSEPGSVVVASGSVAPSIPTASAAAETNAVVLTLGKPTTKVNGEALNNFREFAIYHSTTSTIDIENDGTYDGIILTPATRKPYPCLVTTYFVVTAFDTFDNQSAGAAEISSSPNTGETILANLVPNPFFEIDSDGDGTPNEWTKDAEWAKVADSYFGTYSMKGSGTAKNLTSDKVTWPYSLYDLICTGYAKGSASPTNPVPGTSISITDGGKAIARSGNYLAAASDEANDEWKLWDVSDSLNPAVVATVDNVSVPLYFAFYGGYLYVASDADGNAIKIYSLATPTAPSLVATFDITTNDAGTWDVTGIDVKDDYLLVAYYAVGTAKAQCVDVTDPALPVYKSDLEISAGNNEKTGRIVGRAGECVVIGEYDLTSAETFDPNRGWFLGIDGAGTLSVDGTYSAGAGDYFSDDIVLHGDYAYMSVRDDKARTYREDYSSELSGNDGTVGKKCIAREASGRIWIAYTRAYDAPPWTYIIYAAYSDDDGGTWTEETVISDAVAVKRILGLACDSSDNVHICFYETTTGDIFWSYRSSASGDWATNKETVTAVARTSSSCAFCLDSDGYPNVFFPAADEHPQHTYRTSASADWANNLDEISTEDIKIYDAIEDAQGILHVVGWEDIIFDFWHADNDGGWSSRNIAGDAINAVLCEEGSGNVWAAISYGTSVVAVYWDGSSWSSPETITSETVAGSLEMTYSADGVLHVGVGDNSPIRIGLFSRISGSWVSLGWETECFDVSFPCVSLYTSEGRNVGGMTSGLTYLTENYSTDKPVFKSKALSDWGGLTSDTQYELRVLDVSTWATPAIEGSDLGSYKGSTGNSSFRTGDKLCIQGSYLYILRTDDILGYSYIAAWDISAPELPVYEDAAQINAWTGTPVEAPHNFVVIGSIGFYADVAATKLWIDRMASLDWAFQILFYDGADNLLDTLNVYEGDEDSPITGDDWTVFSKRVPIEDVPAGTAKVAFRCVADCGADYVYVDNLEAVFDTA